MSEPSAKPHIRVYRCPTCKIGLVVPTSRDGRFATHRDVIINIPMKVFIPQCNRCKADFIDGVTEKILSEVLEAEFKRHEKEIAAAYERLRRRKGIN